MPRTDLPLLAKIQNQFRLALRHVSYFSQGNRAKFAGGIIAGSVVSIADSIMIYVSGAFIDSVVSYYNHKTVVVFAGFSIPSPILYMVLLFSLWIVKRVANYSYLICRTIIKHSAMARFRVDVTRKFYTLNMIDVDKEDVKSDIENIQMFWIDKSLAFYDNFVGLIQLMIMIGAALTAIAAFSPWLVLVIPLLPLIEIVVHYLGNHEYRRYVKNVGNLLVQRTYLFQTAVDTRTFAEKKVNNIHALFEEKLHHVSTLLQEGYTKINNKIETETVVTSVFDMLLLNIVKVWTILSSIVAQVPVGRITAIIGYMDSLYHNTYMIQVKIISIIDELSYASRLYKYLDRKGYMDGVASGNERIPPGVFGIRFEGAFLKYETAANNILDNVSLEIHPGDRVIVLGKDGSGKSSLIKVLSTLYPLTAGKLHFDGKEVNELARGEVKDKLSIVTEDTGRYYLSLRDNIVMGDSAKPFDEILYRKALEITGLDVWMRDAQIDDQAVTMGSFYDNGVDISSGHWQRIALARAIYRNRDVFILDQPFTFVDKASVSEIFPKFIAYLGNRTLVYIGEEIPFPQYFTAIYEMHKGKIELLNKQEQVRRGWRRQATKTRTTKPVVRKATVTTVKVKRSVVKKATPSRRSKAPSV